MYRPSSIWKFVVSLLVLSCSALCSGGTIKSAAASRAKKQATPAQGNGSVTPIDINIPYCDAYFPYQFTWVQTPTGEKKGKISEVFDDANLPPNVPEAKISQFLDAKQSVTDEIQKDGSFIDPGCPILGNPSNHFLADGSDVTRLLTRLAYTNPGNDHGTKPLCSDPTAIIPTVDPDRVKPASAQYYLIHIVHWTKEEGSSYSTSASDWYIFNISDGKAAHRQVPFTFHPLVSGDLRMFGSQQVFFLAIHLAPINYNENTSFKDDYSAFMKAVTIKYKVQATHVEPANVQDLKALIGVIVGTGAAPAAAAPGTQAAMLLQQRTQPPLNPNLSAYEALLGGSKYVGLYAAAKLTGLTNIPVQINATMSASLPKPDATSAPSYTTSGGPGCPTNAQSKGCFWDDLAAGKGQSAPANTNNNQNTNNNPTTNGTQATNNNQAGCSTVKRGGTCSETVTVQDEGLYRWDVSVGIPFNSIKQLQFGSSGVAPTTISKQSAYGFFVLAPWKEDFVTPPSLGIPHLMFGLPFTGKILDSPFVGAGESINFSKIPGIGKPISNWLSISNLSARFYAGLVESKTFGPPPATGESGPVRWIGKLQYGIEFSVRSISSQLSGSGSNNTTSQDGKKSQSTSSTPSAN